MILFDSLRLMERLFELFILINKILDCIVVFFMQFVMKIDDIGLKVFFDFLMSLLFELCQFAEINLNGFECCLLLKKFHQMRLFLLKVIDLRV